MLRYFPKDAKNTNIISCREEEPAYEELRPVLVIDLQKHGAPFSGFKMTFSYGGAESCLHIASVDGKLASISGIGSLVRRFTSALRPEASPNIEDQVAQCSLIIKSTEGTVTVISLHSCSIGRIGENGSKRHEKALLTYDEYLTIGLLLLNEHSDNLLAD